MTPSVWVAAPVTLIVGYATWADLKSRRIPNWLTGSALLLGILVNGAVDGPGGAWKALLGAVVAGGLLFPGWMMGFMGAGDVKLMGAVGAWLGFPHGLLAALVALIAGGVLAAVAALRNGILLQSLKRAVVLGLRIGAGKGQSVAATPLSGVRFPFAPAVLIGALFVLWQRF